jgi:hypothetical protein
MATRCIGQIRIEVRILAGRLSVATTLAAMIPIKMGGIRTILRCHESALTRSPLWDVAICSVLPME